MHWLASLSMNYLAWYLCLPVLQKNTCHHLESFTEHLPGVLLRKPLYSAGASLIEKGLSRLQRKASTQPALATLVERLGISSGRWWKALKKGPATICRCRKHQEKHTKTVETYVAKGRQLDSHTPYILHTFDDNLRPLQPLPSSNRRDSMAKPYGDTSARNMKILNMATPIHPSHEWPVLKPTRCWGNVVNGQCHKPSPKSQFLWLVFEPSPFLGVVCNIDLPTLPPF